MVLVLCRLQVCSLPAKDTCSREGYFDKKKSKNFSYFSPSSGSLNFHVSKFVTRLLAANGLYHFLEIIGVFYHEKQAVGVTSISIFP